MLETFLASKAGSSFLGSLGSGLGGALGGGPDGPTSATSGAYGSGLDSSGWSVNFSGVQSTATQQDKSGGVPGLGVSGVGAGGVPWWAWLALGGLVLWRLKKKA